MAFTTCSDRMMTYTKETSRNLVPGTQEVDSKPFLKNLTKKVIWNNIVGLNSMKKRNWNTKKQKKPPNSEYLQDIYNNEEFEKDNLKITKNLQKNIPQSSFLSTTDRFPTTKKVSSNKTKPENTKPKLENEPYPENYYIDPIQPKIGEIHKLQGFKKRFKAKLKTTRTDLSISGRTAREFFLKTDRSKSLGSTQMNTQRDTLRDTFFTNINTEEKIQPLDYQCNSEKDLLENQNCQQPINRTKRELIAGFDISDEEDATTEESSTLRPMKNPITRKEVILGPGQYKLNHKQLDMHIQAPTYSRSKSERFAMTQRDRDMKQLGPGSYSSKQIHYSLQKFKPSSSFVSRTAKDHMANELNKRIFAKRHFSTTTINSRMGGDSGNENGFLDWNENTLYKKIKPNFINGTNPGPGSYQDQHFDSKLKKNDKFCKKNYFNTTSDRFNQEKINPVLGPGAYDKNMLNEFSKKATTSKNQQKDDIPFDCNTEKLYNLAMFTKYPGPGTYKQHSEFGTELVRRNTIHHIRRFDKEASPKINLPLENYNKYEIGPGHYDDMHKNTVAKDLNGGSSFKSTVVRNSTDFCPNKDSKFGKYFVSGQDIQYKKKKQRKNLYGFNNGSYRFNGELEKEREEYEKADDSGFKGLFDYKVDFKGDKDRLNMKYTTSYGGGFRGGFKIDIIDGNLNSGGAVNSESYVPFGRSEDRFKEKEVKGNLGPGSYQVGQQLEKNSYNVKYL